jgi:hypothetical protein
MERLIPWLLNEDRPLRGIAFSDVILAAMGKHVLSIDPKNEIHARKREALEQVKPVLETAVAIS